MDYKVYKPEINLKDLFFHILYRWRSILTVVCIFCLLLGGYRAVRNLTTPALKPESVDEYAQEQALYELAVAEYELNRAVYSQNIDIYEKMLEQQKIYMEKSILMHTDPYNKPIATADFFIKLDDSEWERLPNNENLSLDPVKSVMQAYVSGFGSIIDWEPLEQLTDVESLYLRELITVSPDYNSDTFSLTVVYSDADTGQQLLGKIIDQILDRQQTVADSVAAHTLTMLSQSFTYMIDSSLADTQKDNADTVNTYEQYILENRNALAKLEEPEEPKKFSVLSGLFKYLVLGVAAGIFLMAGFYGVRYLLLDVVRTDRELKERFGYQLLGSFARPDRKGIMSFVDRLLERMEGTRGKPSDAVVCQCIAANIINLAKDKKSLLLTGTISPEQLEVLAKGVTPDLNEMQLQVMDNMNRSPETLKQLAKCDGVILAEKRNASKYAEIQAEQELIAALKIPVVGYIML